MDVSSLPFIVMVGPVAILCLVIAFIFVKPLFMKVDEERSKFGKDGKMVNLRELHRKQAALSSHEVENVNDTEDESAGLSGRKEGE